MSRFTGTGSLGFGVNTGNPIANLGLNVGRMAARVPTSLSLRIYLSSEA
jgi:hypothetical protein